MRVLRNRALQGARVGQGHWNDRFAIDAEIDKIGRGEGTVKPYVFNPKGEADIRGDEK